MEQHLLTSYHYAVLSVVLAQFGPKGFADGMEGVIRLVEAAPKLEASSGANKSYPERLYLLLIKAITLVVGLNASCTPPVVRLPWPVCGQVIWLGELHAVLPHAHLCFK